MLVFKILSFSLAKSALSFSRLSLNLLNSSLSFSIFSLSNCSGVGSFGTAAFFTGTAGFFLSGSVLTACRVAGFAGFAPAVVGWPVLTPVAVVAPAGFEEATAGFVVDWAGFDDVAAGFAPEIVVGLSVGLVAVGFAEFAAAAGFEFDTGFAAIFELVDCPAAGFAGAAVVFGTGFTEEEEIEGDPGAEDGGEVRREEAEEDKMEGESVWCSTLTLEEEEEREEGVGGELISFSVVVTWDEMEGEVLSFSLGEGSNQEGGTFP